jgi:hypothetical protein
VQRPHTRRHAIAGVLALGVVLAACNGDGSSTTDGDTPPPVVEPDAPDEAPGEQVEDDDGDGTTDDEQATTGDGDDQAVTDDGGVEPLAGEPTTGPADADGEAGTLAVTDVRLASHEGFDRIVFETEGDGVPGWFVEHGEATSQGSGAPVEVDGDANLRVAIDLVTLPPDLPDHLQVWEGERLDGPRGGVVAEVVEDTIFEGIHLFFVGLDRERGFVVDRLEDPDRVVVDVHHDG